MVLIVSMTLTFAILAQARKSIIAAVRYAMNMKWTIDAPILTVLAADYNLEDKI